MTDHAPTPPGGARQLPRHTTPTWEAELLISGVAVFAMLQLPGWLDDALFALMPRLDQTWSQIAKLGYIYSKSVALILAATFVIHLLLRARWIALVGIHSIYPGDVRWDRLRMGPLQREVEREHQESTEVVIERADNLATTVFASGIMLALVLVIVTLPVTLLTGAATALASSLGQEDLGLLLFGAVFLAFLLPYVLAMLLDRRFGAEWQPDGRWHKAVTAILHLYAKAGVRAGNNRIRALLASNGGDRRVGILIFLIMFATAGSVMVTYGNMLSDKPFGNYGLFPAAASPAVAAAYYDDRRNPARDPLVPFIQSMTVEDAYVQLIVPYAPRQDAPAMQRACPTGRQSGDATLLACLQALHAVLLDGKPVAGLRYEIASDARTDRPALLAMIDVRGLAPGRHELRIARAMAADKSNGNDAYDVIPFWR